MGVTFKDSVTQADSWTDVYTTPLQMAASRLQGSSTDGCQLYVIIMRIAIPMAVIILGLIGNSLTLVILRQDLNKSPTIFLLFCLAMADSALLLTYGAVTLPYHTLMAMGRQQYSTWVRNELKTKFNSMGPTCIMISMGLTVAVTWQRFVSVCLPYKVKSYGSMRVARIQALAVVIFSVTFNLPRWFENEVVYDELNPGVSRLSATSLAQDEAYKMVYGVLLYYIMLYILPMGALSCMTISLMRALRNNRIKHRAMVATSASKPSRAKEELTLSLVIVVIVFITCHFFGPIRRLLILLYPDPSQRQCGGVHFYFGAIALTATITNSAVNFVIYILCARRFRRQMTAMLTKCMLGTRIQPMPRASKPANSQTSGNALDGTFPGNSQINSTQLHKAAINGSESGQHM